MKQKTLLMRKRTPPQIRGHNSKSRFNVLRWGRQTGKTTYGIDKMTYKPLIGRKGGVYWYVLQTYSAAEVAYDRHCRILHQSKELLKKKPNDSELSIPYFNDAKLFYKSGEVLEDLRVETLDGAVIDECRQQDPKLWTRVMRPMLARRKAWCDFLSTPNGFDWFYDLNNFADLHPEEWSTFHSPCTEAPWWTPEEIDSSRQTMSEAEFAQEIMAEFRDLVSGKAYMTFGDYNVVDSNPFMGVITHAPHPVLPIVVAMDFNLNPMAWTLGQYRGEDFYWYDEIYLRNSHTQEAVKELIERVRGHKPGIIIVGDATGKAGQRAAAGQSDYDIIFQALKSAGITYLNRTPDSNPAVKDRVNTMNAACKAADGQVHMFVLRSGCPMLIRDMRRVAWKSGATMILDQTKDPDLTHSSDGVGYAHCVLAPLRGIRNVGTLKVITRW